MTKVDVAKLANLARIAIPDEDIKKLEQEIPEILTFVEHINEAGGEVTKEAGEHYNVMREDTNAHESGKYTEDMVTSMPDSKNGYLRVRKIITQD